MGGDGKGIGRGVGGEWEKSRRGMRGDGSGRGGGRVQGTQAEIWLVIPVQWGTECFFILILAKSTTGTCKTMYQA